MIITTVRSNWYMCHITLYNGATACGYGKSIADAIMDCMKDRSIINNLK